MNRFLLAVFMLLALAGSAFWLFHTQLRVQSGPYLALFISLALVLGAFVALTNSDVIEGLRQRAERSLSQAIGMPLLLLAPYLIYSAGAHTLSSHAFLKLLVYIELPSLILLPDRTRVVRKVSWRDFAAMLALAVPVPTGWLSGIWPFPFALSFFRSLYAVSSGVYAFVVIRHMPGVGYRLVWRKKDFIYGSLYFVAFAVLAIPLGYAIHFIRLRPHGISPLVFAVRFVGTYLVIAIPEEVLFRGILQNTLEQCFHSKRRELYALVLASVIFGASHLHHPPVPNWRYALMATLAGLFYGNVFRKRRRTSACALTHALVDTVWTTWF